MSILITPHELHDRLAGPGAPRLLDVRWSLARPNGQASYLAGHIPGAVYVDLESELADPPSPGAGRHPLPSLERLTAAARRWGLCEGDAVVVYDDAANMAAARAWWLLRDAGVEDVKLLDGAWSAWLDAGLPVERGIVEPVPGTITLTSGRMPTVDIDDVAKLVGCGVLLDARAGERYRGEREPIDARAGHIPGAVSAPTAANVDRRGRFLPPCILRARFTELGVADGIPVAVYCGSGIAAAHEVAALELAGHRAALFPGSWSQWSNDPERPVATGADPCGALL